MHGCLPKGRETCFFQWCGNLIVQRLVHFGQLPFQVCWSSLYMEIWAHTQASSSPLMLCLWICNPRHLSRALTLSVFNVWAVFRQSIVDLGSWDIAGTSSTWHRMHSQCSVPSGFVFFCIQTLGSAGHPWNPANLRVLAMWSAILLLGILTHEGLSWLWWADQLGLVQIQVQLWTNTSP